MMNAITIRNLSDEASRALEARAAGNGRSAEAEVEHILEDMLVQRAGVPEDRSAKGFVDALQQLAKDYPELADIDFPRDQTVAKGVLFE